MKQKVNRFFEYTFFSWVSDYIKNIKQYREVPSGNSNIFETNLPVLFSSNFDLKEDVFDFQKNLLFQYQYKLNENEKNFKIGKRLIKSFRNEFISCLTFKALVIVLTTWLNITLKSFMEAVNPSSKLIQCLILIGLQTFKIFLDSHTNFLIAKMSLNIQTFIIRASYEDLSRINFTLTKTNNNELKNIPNIYNLIFGDLNSLESFMQALIELIISPIKIIGVWILLQRNIGFSANLSVLTYVLLYLLSLTLQVVGSLYKIKFMKFRDIRIFKCHEYFSSLPTFRQLFWEEIVYEDLMSVRRMEVKANLTRFLYLMSGTFLEYNSLSIAKYVSFSSFIYQSYTQLSSSNSFGATITSRISTLHALNMLTSPTRNIASSIVEGIISFKRIVDFFERNSDIPLIKKITEKNQANVIDQKKYINRTDLKEFSRDDSVLFNFEHINPLKFENSEMNYFINMSNLHNSKLELNNSHLKLKTNELYILSGKSGSGKTLLINKILDQFYSMESQYINIFHSSQDFWFPKGTVRSIILFGREYDQTNYKRVIKACSLDVDFNMWKEGDLRQLDESDQTLSNGQKSRISLARTLYYLLFMQKTKNKENIKSLIILDDIFSSLDIQTSIEIFENLFKKDGGLVSKESCIVTIGIDCISMLTSNVKFSRGKLVKVVIMDKGSISYSGLLQSYLDEFSSFRKDGHLGLNHEYNNSGNNKCEKKCNRNEEMRNEILVDSEISLNTNNNKETTFQTNNFFYSKYIYYFEYIGRTYFLIFLLVCIFKIGITKFMDIYLASYSFSKSPKIFIINYSVLLIIKLILECFTFISEALLSAKSSSQIHKNYLISLLKAPLSFFSFIPISKLLNRFNLDLLVLDDILVRKIIGVMIRIFEPFIHLFLVFFSNPIFIPFSITHIIFIIISYGLPLFSIYKEAQMMILSISSKLNNTFSEILKGWKVIRDFNNYSLYREILCFNLLDIIKMRIVQISVIKWASFRIQLFSGPLVILLYLVYILYIILFQVKISESFNLNEIELGYVIYFYITFTETLNLIFIKISSLEKDMCSLERLIEYSNKPFNKSKHLEDFEQEGIIFDEQISTDSNTKLKFTNVELSYQVSDFTGNNNHLEFKAIKDFNLELNSNEHIGIIGRTGCGKSTLIKGILGAVTLSSGKIQFGQVEICNLSREKRREIIGIVPQTPLKLNNWSIRKYLDPFFEHSPDKILQVLKLTKFYNIIANKIQVAKSLDLVKISDYDQENCISLTDFHLKYLNFVRLLLNRKQYKIILLDEPTIEAQIELRSKASRPYHEYLKLVPIEELIRDYFQHCCVVIVSHNFNALKFCSRIINLNNYKTSLKEKQEIIKSDCFSKNE
ncbi:ABC transporter family [Cryptosporidium sp. chipmunk genotype I]|uniref:ABC transporter family n=1 Tax=Cryptosporidium sp. chipmunk genotype I TaxID=1280935 RepID=UPI003519F208|nr:ABC transporter family [Cryptosporidium sp. chipmunk genotype I]